MREMEQSDIIQAAWVLCTAWGRTAEQEADTLAIQFAALGAQPAAQIWRDVARVVRTIQQGEAAPMLQ
jgi:hypothetical protein